MRAIRARLAVIAGFTLAIQLGIVPAASMALCCGHADQTAASHCDQPACSENEAAQACPMHKGTTAPATSQMRSCCDMHEQALVALLGVVAIPELSPESSPAIDGSPILVTAVESLLARTRPPDAPPPRA
jgi:hypothetical protein